MWVQICRRTFEREVKKRISSENTRMKDGWLLAVTLWLNCSITQQPEQTSVFIQDFVRILFHLLSFTLTVLLIYSNLFLSDIYGRNVDARGHNLLGYSHLSGFMVCGLANCPARFSFAYKSRVSFHMGGWHIIISWTGKPLCSSKMTLICCY